MTPSDASSERRRHFALRDAVQDLLEHVRLLSRRAGEMPSEDLNHAQDRLEWLADEVWRALTDMEDGE